MERVRVTYAPISRAKCHRLGVTFRGVKSPMRCQIECRCAIGDLSYERELCIDWTAMDLRMRRLWHGIYKERIFGWEKCQVLTWRFSVIGHITVIRPYVSEMRCKNRVFKWKLKWHYSAQSNIDPLVHRIVIHRYEESHDQSKIRLSASYAT